jgi:hypothetical protein
MKSPQPIENRLQSTGTTLRDRPSVVDQVMAEIQRRAAARPSRPQTDPTTSRQ